MNISLRFLLPCLLAGSSLLLLSGCDELEDRSGGREYHRHSEGDRYRSDRHYSYGAADSGRRFETVERSNRYDNDRDVRDRDYDRHDRHSNYQDNSRTVVVAPRSGSNHSRGYASTTSRNTYSARTRPGSGGGDSRAVVANTSHGSHAGTHHAPAGARPGARSSTNVVVKVSSQNKQSGSKEKEKEKKKH